MMLYPLLDVGRRLLQDAAEGDDCAKPDDSQSIHRGLRVGGLFIILFVTSLGLTVPLITRHFGAIFFLARTFGAGVILSTALNHILADASDDLSNPCLGLSTEYPWGFCIAGATLMFTFMVEYAIGTYIRHRFGSSLPIQHGSHPEVPDQEHAIVADPEKREAMQLLDATVASYTLEAGVIIHSIFVGITYGASTDLGTIRALTIALGFHQGIEGISLGCTFLDAKYHPMKYFLFALAYVLITPIGIAIGLGVGNTYHEGSKAALGTQGTLNAVAAGILLYNSLEDLIVPAFIGYGHSHGDPGVPSSGRPTWLTILGFLSMLTGYAIQALIAKWA